MGDLEALGKILEYGNSYGYSNNTASLIQTLGILALVLAIVATVLSFIFITPEKKRASLPKFFQVVADIFNFKGLIIEKILKALYIFLTIYVILEGFFMIFAGANFLGCLLIMILGPVIIRVIFEFCMMLILLVKNVISINAKMKSQNDKTEASAFDFDYTQIKNDAPADEKTAATDAAFCPNCGTKVEGGNTFCPNCGTNINN